MSATTSMSNRLALGAGCYWGTEKFVVKDFQKHHPGAIRTAKVGFMATDPHNPIRNPGYRAVCSGRTGYVEVLMVELNDSATTFEALIRFFFQFHDPTTKDRQGNDTGPQYASVIFCEDEAQAEIARTVKSELQGLVHRGKIGKYLRRTVETKVLPTTNSVEVHEEHQEYLAKHPLGYCNHFLRFPAWPEINISSSVNNSGNEKNTIKEVDAPIPTPKVTGPIRSAFRKMFAKVH